LTADAALLRRQHSASEPAYEERQRSASRQAVSRPSFSWRPD